MATYGSTLRRGLPRVPGGEPWPPGTFVPAVAPAAGAGAPSGASATGNAAAVPPPRHEPEVPSGNGAADAADAGAARADVAVTGVGGAADAPSAGVAAVAAPVVAPVVAPPEGPARAIRRGLPRVPGGEPWPPASFAASSSSTSVAPSSAAPASAAAPAASAARASDAPGAVPVAAPVSGTVPHERPESEAPARSEDAGAPASGAEAPVLRRGLPRTTGGEPWPPASFVPRAPAAAEAHSAVPQGLQESEAPSGDEGALATPAAPAVTPDAAVAEAEAVVAAPAAPAATAAAAAADSAPAGPLPFTPTVFPTASSTRWSALRAERAGKGPLPAPEPARIGPFTRGQWAGAVVVGGLGLLFAAAMLVLVVRWLVSLGPVQDFLATYPGEYHLPEGAPVGLPAWIGWQHFFNVFLMVLIIRSGLQVRREKRPAAFWSPRRDKKRKISLNLWFHQALDILWLVNGVVFVVLLFATGQWMRIIPTSWEVFPNALSAALQYVSLDWPTENGWVNYNALQQLAYFATVFLAAPLAAVTGVRMSGVWPKNAKALNKAYPVEWARAVHFPVMIYFVLFIVVHVTLVLATGALRNLNHMYAAQDVVNWAGFWIFAASLVVIAAGWVAARPLVIAPIARLFGSVSSR